MKRVLIANRGEIACRLMLACREHGAQAVGVYATPDADAPHVYLADAAYELPGETPAKTYLDVARLLAVARASRADAVHPGYGFLSESAEFARAVQAAGLVWVGPPAEAIATMGHKLRARELAAAAGVPVLPGGRLGPGEPLPTRFPVMVKAAGGGGGLGLRRVERAEDLERAVEEARAQCLAAFAGGEVELYWEAYLVGARHLEAQVVAFADGTIRHLGARECSVQRRFQKLVEECPPATLDAAGIEMLGELAVKVAAEVGYRNVGTVEFLWTEEVGPVFIEMNTRLQVEHPVTELVYGVDVPGLQLAIALGAAAPDAWPQPHGHAIEARLYAEDPITGAPAAGRIDHLRWPGGPWIRVDAGVQEGQTLPIAFDALLAKIIAWGPTRDAARRRLADALARTEVAGTLTTNLLQLRAIVDSGDFRAGRLNAAALSGGVLEFPPADAATAALLAASVMSGGRSSEPTRTNPTSWARRPWRTQA